MKGWGGARPSRPTRSRSTSGRSDPKPSLTPVAVAAAAIAIAVALAACGGGGSSAAKDRGDFRVALDPPQGAHERAVERMMRDRHGADVEGLARALDRALSLPRDVTIKIDHGDPSPYFDPERREIHLQYDFVLYGARVYRDLYPGESPERSLDRAAPLVDFALIHEIAHALVDDYAIPVGGREEGAVDALATVIMGRFVHRGTDIAVRGAAFFDALAGRRGTSFGDSDFWHEHSLDRRRASAVVCWVAGSGGASVRAVADSHLLGADRLRGCPTEYRRNVSSWLRLLKPHLKA